MDGTQVAVPLDRGPEAGSGVVKTEEGSVSRGSKRATRRPLLERAGVLTHVAVAPMPVHDGAVCRPRRTHSPALRAGAVRREDRGFLDGALLAVLQPERHVDVRVPLRSTRIAFHEACSVAAMAGTWPPPPSRAAPPIAFVPRVQHVWDPWRVPVHACVMRYGHAKKHTYGSMVLVPTDQALTATWIGKHDAQRPEMEQDDAQMQSGGWKFPPLSTTRYGARVWYLVSVLLR